MYSKYYNYPYQDDRQTGSGPCVNFSKSPVVGEGLPSASEDALAF